MNDAVDYKALLRKYMEHLEDYCDGPYVDPHSDCVDVPGLSEEEAAALKAIAEEIYER